MPKKYTFDPDCYDLGKKFLDDADTIAWTDADYDQLAQDIQDAIESFINAKEAEQHEPPPEAA